jgi:large conductance mechanosensitive channel
MIRGFRDFLLRGNVVDLAVAVVVGSAFAAVVSTFVSAIVKPLLNSFGSAKTSGLGFSLRHGSASLQQATYVDVSSILNALIVFAITAAVVYFLLIVPMNAFAARRRQGIEAEPPAPSEDVLLLTEIRDLLARERP